MVSDQGFVSWTLFGDILFNLKKVKIVRPYYYDQGFVWRTLFGDDVFQFKKKVKVFDAIRNYNN